jgi:hypothetical protein
LKSFTSVWQRQYLVHKPPSIKEASVVEEEKYYQKFMPIIRFSNASYTDLVKQNRNNIMLIGYENLSLPFLKKSQN